METVQVILFINPTKGILLNNYFKKVQETGVIKVMTDATNRGYKGHGVDGWINLGQGMPEPQTITPDITKSLLSDKGCLEYASVTGVPDLKNQF